MAVKANQGGRLFRRVHKFEKATDSFVMSVRLSVTYILLSA